MGSEMQAGRASQRAPASEEHRPAEIEPPNAEMQAGRASAGDEGNPSTAASASEQAAQGRRNRPGQHQAPASEEHRPAEAERLHTERALIDGRYRLDQPIDRGRTGIVWLAYDTRLHRTVAAKPMYVPDGAGHATDERATELAIQRGGAAIRLGHDCAITVHDVVRGDRHPWMIMEYVPSRSMRTFLAEHGPLTAEQVASLGTQLAGALAAAHALGIVHGAVEPANVLLADDGGVRLTDFGMPGPHHDRAYCSPEIGPARPPTSASDCFGLAATLSAAVGAGRALGGAGHGSGYAPARAGALRELLGRMLRADPAARPSLGELVPWLTAIAEAGPGGPRVATPPPAHPAASVPATPTANTIPTITPIVRGTPNTTGALSPHTPRQPTPAQQTEPLRPPPARAVSQRRAASPPTALAVQHDRPGARPWIIRLLAVLVTAAIGVLVIQWLVG